MFQPILQADDNILKEMRRQEHFAEDNAK